MNRAAAELALRGRHSILGVDTGARLGAALLAYMFAITLIVTLLPFRFRWPHVWRVMLAGPFPDVIANVLLFIPLGFLYCFAAPRAQVRSSVHVMLAGALASVCIETAQLFEAARNATLSDIASNAAGAWLGAVVFRRLSRAVRPDGRVLGWLALELPLMGLVYLLVPLLWASSLASAGDGKRVAVTVLVGVFGALLLGGLQRHYFGPARAARAEDTALFAAVWLVAGAFPLLAWHPLEFCGAVALVGTLSWWQGRRPRKVAENRRFEVPLLKHAAPLYALFLVLAVADPLRAGASGWTMYVGFAGRAGDQIEILRLLELVAAFTLLGYMVVEFHGRERVLYRQALPRLIGWGVGLAFAAQLVRAYAAGAGASIAAGLVLTGATLYGGWLYHLQRAHVVRLLSSGRRGSYSE